jgi:hypothetical protein
MIKNAQYLSKNEHLCEFLNALAKGALRELIVFPSKKGILLQQQ